MPRLIDRGISVRAYDTNGDPVSGALLRVYNPGTSTPVVVYSDQALTVPTSPVANAAGVFPTLYLPSGSYKIDVVAPDTLASLPGFPEDNVLVGGEDAEFSSAAAFLASTEAPRGAGEVWIGGPYTYIEAAPTATDHHVTTAGGVKAYINPENGLHNVGAFGVLGDNTDADAARIAAAVATGIDLFFNAGVYRVNAPLSCANGQTIAGASFDFAPMIVSSVADITGTVFLVNFAATVSGGTPVNSVFDCERGVLLRNFCIYSDAQAKTRPSGWSPVITPWAVTCGTSEENHRSVRDVETRMENVMILEMTHGVRLRKGMERGVISQVRSNCFTVFIDGDACYDNITFEDCRRWPYGGNTGIVQENEFAFTLNNLSGFRFGRIDGLTLARCFTWGCKNGLEFYPSESGDALDGGATTNARIFGSYFDGGDRAIWIHGEYAPGWAPSMTISSSILFHRNRPEIIDEDATIVIESNFGSIRISACEIQSSAFNRTGSHIRLNASRGHLMLDGCDISQWDDENTGATLVDLTGDCRVTISSDTTFSGPQGVTYPVIDGRVNGHTLGPVAFGGLARKDRMEFFSEGDAVGAYDLLRASDDLNGGQQIRFKRQHGSLLAPAAVAAMNSLGSINWLGHNGTAFSLAAFVEAVATDAPDANGHVNGEVQVAVRQGAAFVDAFQVRGGGALSMQAPVTVSQPTRAQAVAWAAGKVLSLGTVLIVGDLGIAFRYTATDTAIPDMPGWVPVGLPTPDHYRAPGAGGDMAPAVQSALEAHPRVVLLPREYLFGSTVDIPSDTVLEIPKGATVKCMAGVWQPLRMIDVERAGVIGHGIVEGNGAPFEFMNTTGGITEGATSGPASAAASGVTVTVTGLGTGWIKEGDAIAWNNGGVQHRRVAMADVEIVGGSATITVNSAFSPAITAGQIVFINQRFNRIIARPTAVSNPQTVVLTYADVNADKGGSGALYAGEQFAFYTNNNGVQNSDIDYSEIYTIAADAVWTGAYPTWTCTVTLDRPLAAPITYPQAITSMQDPRNQIRTAIGFYGTRDCFVENIEFRNLPIHGCGQSVINGPYAGRSPKAPESISLRPRFVNITETNSTLGEGAVVVIANMQDASVIGGMGAGLPAKHYLGIEAVSGFQATGWTAVGMQFGALVTGECNDYVIEGRTRNCVQGLDIRAGSASGLVRGVYDLGTQGGAAIRCEGGDQLVLDVVTRGVGNAGGVWRGSHIVLQPSSAVDPVRDISLRLQSEGSGDHAIYAEDVEGLTILPGSHIRNSANAPLSLTNCTKLDLRGLPPSVLGSTDYGTEAVWETDAIAFTPTLTFATPGDSTWSYVLQSGRYLVQGRMVYLQVRIGATPTIGTGSGALRIEGVPVLPIETGKVVEMVVDWHTQVAPSVRNTMTATYTGGNNFIELFMTGGDANATAVAASMLTSGDPLQFRFSESFNRVD